MTGVRPWEASDRTGGPLDDVLDRVRPSSPDVTVHRLIGTHPANDDNVPGPRGGVERR
jgi:hypothetical protein